MLSDSIVSRALEIIETNKGIDESEAVKIALVEEFKMINEIIENKTERAVNLRKAMCYVIYTKIHLKNAIEKQ